MGISAAAGLWAREGLNFHYTLKKLPLYIRLCPLLLRKALGRKATVRNNKEKSKENSGLGNFWPTIVSNKV